MLGNDAMFVLEAVKDNVLSLSSLLALVNERVLHTFDQLKEVNALNKEQAKQYTEVIGLSNAIIHSLKMLAQSIDEHRKDAVRQDGVIDRVCEKVDDFQNDFRSRFIEIERITNEMNKMNEHLSHIRMTLSPKEIPQGVADEKKVPAWLKAVIVAGSLGIGGAGFWKVVELIITGK